MQNAFFVGVMAFLRHNGVPNSWMDELKGLGFDITIWNFRTWVKSLSGRAQTTSRELANNVFSMCFRDRKLPIGTNNLSDYLRGDNASIEFEFYNLNASNRPIRNITKSEYKLIPGTKSINIGTRRAIKMMRVTPNIGGLLVTDKSATPGRVIEYPIGPGRSMTLDESLHTKPLDLLFQMQHYGGNTTDASLTIQW
jgi:hypothetical protein